jgi:hypothetical protein
MLNSTFVPRNALLLIVKCVVEVQVDRTVLRRVVTETTLDLKLALMTAVEWVMVMEAATEAVTVVVNYEETPQIRTAIVAWERSREAEVDQGAEVEAKTGAEDLAVVLPAPALRKQSVLLSLRLLPLLLQGSGTYWQLRNRTHVVMVRRLSVTIQRTWPLPQPLLQMPLRKLLSVVFLSLLSLGKLRPFMGSAILCGVRRAQWWEEISHVFPLFPEMNKPAKDFRILPLAHLLRLGLPALRRAPVMPQDQ